MSTLESSEAHFVKLGYEIENDHEGDLVNFHIALQARYPNSTFVRNCVTLKPPPNAASGKDDHEVRSIKKIGQCR